MLHRLLLSVLIYLSLSVSVHAAECRETFTDGLTNSKNNGKIHFKDQAKLFNGNDTVLTTTEIKNDNDRNAHTCAFSDGTGADCSVSGGVVPQLIRSYIASSSNNKLEITSSKTINEGSDNDYYHNDYEEIKIKSGGRLTMSADFDSYSIEKLIIENNSSVVLTVGDYYFEEIEMKDSSQLIAPSSGTARIYIKKKAEFKESSIINGGEGGDPSRLVIYAFGDELKFEKSVSFAGYIYSEVRVELKEDSKVFGAISSEDEIHLEGDSVVTYDDAIDDTDFGGMCGPLPPVVLEPILEYRFDECRYTGNAGDVIDETGDFSGRSVGVSSPIDTAVINKSLDLRANNTSDWVHIPSSAVDGLNDFSVSVWFKTSEDKSQQEILHALGQSSGDDELEIYLKNDNDVTIKVRDKSQNLSSATRLTDGAWHHLVVTRVDEDVCLFIDGAEQDCDDGVDDGALSVNNANAVVIGQEQDSFGGSFSTSQNFEGQLDEFKIFNEKLSNTDVASIYQSELAGKSFDGSARSPVVCSTLISEYRFEETSWDGSQNEIIDNTGNGYHGRVDNNVETKTASPALSGDFGTCGYADLNDGSIKIEGLPLDTSVNGAKTTITFWMKWDGTNSVMPIGWNFHDIWMYAGHMGFNTWNSDIYGISSSGLANEWHHVAVEFTNGSVTSNRIYLDGVEQVLRQRTSRRPNNSRAYVKSELRIGGVSNSSSYDFHGLLDEVRVYEGTLTTAEINAIMNDRHSCNSSAVIDHYEIGHGGQGLTCEAEGITIKACTNADCSELSDASITLDITANGSTVETSTFTGTGNVSLNHTSVETLALSVTNASASALNPLTCNGSTNASACEIGFTNAGFRFLSDSGNSTTIPNQIAGEIFPKALKIQAVKDTKGVCTGFFTANSGNHAVNLSQINVNPSTSGLNFDVDGQNIGVNPTVTLEFDSTSTATISNPVYNDAGEIRLKADFDDGTVELTGSSTSFWVRPDRLQVIAKSGSINLDGSTADAITIHKAGDNFDLIVSAYNANNVITPNYVPGQIQLKLERTGPTLSGSVNGGFSYAATTPLQSATGTVLFSDVSLESFTSGVSTYSGAKYSEVGLLKLDVQDRDYGNTGIVVPAAEINIGRFTPDHFKQSIAEQGALFATCGVSSMFAYSGQTDEVDSSIGAISYARKPVFEISAYNKQGVITQNYDGDFIKLNADDVVIIAPTSDSANSFALLANIDTDTATLSQNNLTTASSGTVLAKGILHYQLSDLDNYVYTRGNHALVAPFTSEFEIAIDTISDADSIDLMPSDGSARTTEAAEPNGVEIRFGRLVLKNSFGPDAVNLTQPLQVEHFNGSNFIVSADNNCLSYDDSKFSSTPNIDMLGGTGTFINGETRAIQLNGQDADSSGSINVSYDIYDWLEFDWDNVTGDDDPSAIATFGLFRGNDRVIYRRKVVD